MFDDLDQIDWAGLRADQAPQFVRGLASEDQSIRIESFHELRDHDLHERPDLACFVVPYVLRILEHQEINSETAWLIELLRALRKYAKGFMNRAISRDIEKKSSKKIIAEIDRSIELYRRLSTAPLARDAALDLVADIENG